MKIVLRKQNITRCQMLFLMLWMQHTFLYTVSLVLLKFPVIGEWLKLIFIPAVLLLTVVASLPELIHRIRMGDMLLLAGAMAFWFASKAAHPGYRLYFDASQGAAFSAFLMFFVAKYAFGDRIHDDFDRLMIFASSLCVLSVIVLFLRELSVAGAHESMDLAYKAMPGMLVILAFGLKKANKSLLIFSAFNLLLLLFMGTRGPILIFVLYVVGYYIFLVKNSALKSLVMVGMAVFMMLDHFFGFFRWIIMGMASFTRTIGVSSRIFDMILHQNSGDRNGRDIIQERLLGDIEQNPWGSGLFSDRYFTEMLWGNKSGTYAHNLVVELWTDFGVLIGSAVTFFIVLTAFRVFFNKTMNENEKTLAAVVFCCGILKLFLSGSWIVEPYFFLFLGMSCALLKKYNPDPGCIHIGSYTLRIKISSKHAADRAK